MKKLIFCLVFLSITFADYKITQYYGYSDDVNIIIKKSWITKKWGYVGSSSMSNVHFADLKTNKEIIISMPFSIEEL